LPGPVAIDTRQSQDGIAKNGLHQPRLSAIILSPWLPALILIAAPFASRLSRYTDRIPKLAGSMFVKFAYDPPLKPVSGLVREARDDNALGHM
jgi:hypothetical protein